ncbi:MAG: beta-mannanase [bacterium]
MNKYTLNIDGYFECDGARFIPVGANWWPASCGVELWQQWPEDEIKHDLDVMVKLGLNSLRFFLRWQDFEPEAGVYNHLNFERLDMLLGWFAEHNLAAHPSLFVGFMSGGVFWPQWKEGRNLFSDPYMCERSTAFAKEATKVIARHKNCVLAIDQGNELCCLEDSRQAPPSAVQNWCSDINLAIRTEWQNAIIISGNEQNQIQSDTGWRLDNQQDCDLLSMHAYPVPGWHSVAFDGMTDLFCQSLLPFYTRVAREFAPVMVQEFGTIVTFGKKQQDSYLKTILPECWKSGSNGFLWWCLRDITGDIHPYSAHGFETTLGLIDANDNVKPGLEYYIKFCKSLNELPAPIESKNAIGLYWPKFWWNRDVPENAGNNPSTNTSHLLIANHLLRTGGHDVQIVRGDLPLTGDVKVLIITSINLRVEEAEALSEWVLNGGKLIWHGVDNETWGTAYKNLIGAVPVDYRAIAGPRIGEIGGKNWSFNSFPRGKRCEIETRGADVLIADQDGNPLATRYHLGKGTVIAVYPTVEDMPVSVSDNPAKRDEWAAWYEAMLVEVEK